MIQGDVSTAVSITRMEQLRTRQEESGTALLEAPAAMVMGSGQPELGVGDRPVAEGWKRVGFEVPSITTIL